MSTPITPEQMTEIVRAAAQRAAREYLEAQGNPAPAGPAGTGPVPPPPVYPDAEHFYTDYFSPVFARDPKLSSIRWCAAPFRHPEFDTVMTSLWQAWEFLHREDPAMGIPVWVRDWAYPLLDRLTYTDGVFAHCTRKEGGHDSDESVRPLAEVQPSR